MNDGIDYKKIEECMVEMYGHPESMHPDWDMFTEKYRNYVKFLTVDGHSLTTVIANTFCRLSVEHDLIHGHLPEGKCKKSHISEDVRSALRLGKSPNHPKQAPIGNHKYMIRWSTALYLTREKRAGDPRIMEASIKGNLEEIDWVKAIRKLRKVVNSQNGNVLWKDHNEFQQTWLKETKMCRMDFHRGPLGERNDNDLSLETHYPLSSSQQRIILDVIRINSVPPNRIYIDDHSEEQCVKRQLRLHSIVAQFHT